MTLTIFFYLFGTLATVRVNTGYYHEFMLRDRPHLCQYMPPRRDARRLTADPDHEPDFYRISVLFPLSSSSKEEEDGVRPDPVVPDMQDIISISSSSVAPTSQTPSIPSHLSSCIFSSPTTNSTTTKTQPPSEVPSLPDALLKLLAQSVVSSQPQPPLTTTTTAFPPPLQQPPAPVYVPPPAPEQPQSQAASTDLAQLLLTALTHTADTAAAVAPVTQPLSSPPPLPPPSKAVVDIPAINVPTAALAVALLQQIMMLQQQQQQQS